MKKIWLVITLCLLGAVLVKAQRNTSSLSTEDVNKIHVSLAKQAKRINLSPAQVDKLSKILPVYAANLKKAHSAKQKAVLGKQFRTELVSILSDTQIKALLGK